MHIHMNITHSRTLLCWYFRRRYERMSGVVHHWQMCCTRNSLHHQSCLCLLLGAGLFLDDWRMISHVSWWLQFCWHKLVTSTGFSHHIFYHMRQLNYFCGPANLTATFSISLDETPGILLTKMAITASPWFKRTVPETCWKTHWLYVTNGNHVPPGSGWFSLLEISWWSEPLSSVNLKGMALTKKTEETP